MQPKVGSPPSNHLVIVPIPVTQSISIIDDITIIIIVICITGYVWVLWTCLSQCGDHSVPLEAVRKYWASQCDCWTLPDVDVVGVP
eukprot:4318400-Amphidinium_carterae.1